MRWALGSAGRSPWRSCGQPFGVRALALSPWPSPPLPTTGQGHRWPPAGQQRPGARSRCWFRRCQAVPGAGLVPRVPGLLGRNALLVLSWLVGLQVGAVLARAGGGGSRAVPGTAVPFAAGAWPCGPGRGGSCRRERRCSSEAATPIVRMPSAAITAKRAMRTNTGPQYLGMTPGVGPDRQGRWPVRRRLR